MTVIDLDGSRPAAEPSARPPIRSLRPFGLALTVVLVFALGGAAPIAATLWRGAGHIPLAAGDSYAVDGDLVITVEDALRKATLSAWRADRFQRVWSTDLDLGDDPDPSVRFSGLRMRPVGDRLLVQTHDYRTLAVDRRSGRTLWEAPTPIEPAAPGVGLVSRETFPPGSASEFDGSGGTVYLASDGRQYRKPPLSTDTSGIDLATGRTRWTRHDPGSILTAPAGPRLMVVAGDRMQLLNPENGHVLAERGTANVMSAQAVDDLMLVGEGEQTAAYDAVTLEPRWRAPELRATDELAGGICDGLICRTGADGQEVVDPATGRTTWTAAREMTLRRLGPVVLEMDTSSQRPLRLLDAVTGEVRVALGTWQMVTRFGPILLSRVEPGGKRLSFAVVRGTEVQPLGYATMSAPECRAGTGVVACRTGTGLELFTYQMKQR
ncbi:MAG: PQQ-binding-like beta-propeller repeat protein [Actinoplanes sp.]